MTCDCGSIEFFVFRFSPGDSSDVGLRRIYTCTKCGEQLRLYQTCDAWREARRPPLERASGTAEGKVMIVEREKIFGEGI